ncbi:Phospholipase D/Transphosphatidylase [Crocosphaera watsonii WH 8501]|uniref:phospholipase D n=1 Tax=Crocosphaera watsonii WH 8501 TaxID=165597 RepID=Q4C387_CROWT|nr:phospholipase D-like domain-containing protein [Crocosphaera watsonii]EAM50623.1 Phospholipase D/Transphosphatidylase [Crocosphaera watsonii WH 8501]
MEKFYQKGWQFVGLLLWIFWGLVACDHSPEIQRSPPLPQDPLIKVYFNLNQAKGADYSDPYRNIDRPGDNLENIIINSINSAQSTIDIAVQEFRLPNIAKALVKQAEKGIEVRIILENTYNRTLTNVSSQIISNIEPRERQRYEQYINFIDLNNDQILSKKELEERDILTILNKDNISLIDDTEDGSKGTGLMHHKFIVIDKKFIIVSSANFTLSGIHGDFNNEETRGNANNLLKIE